MITFQEKNKYIVLASVIGFAWIVVFGILFAFFYTLNRKLPPSTAEKDSQKRLDIVQAILKRYLGKNWTYTLLTISLLFFLLGIAVAVQSEGQPRIIQIEKQYATTTLIVLSAFFILFAIATILGFSYFYFFKVDPEVALLEEQKQKQDQMFLFLIIFVSLFALTWFGGFFYRKLKK